MILYSIADKTHISHFPLDFILFDPFTADMCGRRFDSRFDSRKEIPRKLWGHVYTLPIMGNGGMGIFTPFNRLERGLRKIKQILHIYNCDLKMS